jgi:hypothetical protein
MADDALVLEHARDLRFVVTGNASGVEAVEGFPEIPALAQDRDPAQAGLEAVEDQFLVEGAVVALGDAPLGVVVGDVERVGSGPGAARCGSDTQGGCRQDQRVMRAADLERPRPLAAVSSCVVAQAGRGAAWHRPMGPCDAQHFAQFGVVPDFSGRAMGRQRRWPRRRAGCACAAVARCFMRAVSSCPT